MKKENVITIFGSSRPQPGDPEYLLAYDLGRELATAGFAICNGGYRGIMEASARGAKNAGGHTIGIITEAIGDREANEWMDTVVSRKTLVDRLLELIARGDAYVVLKGGTGTLLELAAVWEFINKGMMVERPIIVLGDFWSGVVKTLKDELDWEGLERCTRHVTLASSPEECAALLRQQLKGLGYGG